MIPNLISLFRVLCIPFFIWTLKESRIGLALGIFTLAVLSDFVDGYLARKIPQQSPAGALLDPLADKFLLMTAFVCMYALKNLAINIPFWVLLIVMSRDLIILVGTGLLFLMGTPIEIRPTIWGKLTTFFQMLTVLSVLVGMVYSYVIWNIAVLFTLISGINYIFKGIQTMHRPNPVR